MTVQAPTQPQRRADWFELFFDLVFVVTVSLLAGGLHGRPGWADYGTFLALFFPAWWAWVNLMVAVNLFGARWTRTHLLIAMPGLGVMAAAAPDGLGSRAWAFALGCAWARLVIFSIYWTRTRTTLTDIPRWRPVVYGVLSVGIWAASALVPAPGRYALWILVTGIEVALVSSAAILAAAATEAVFEPEHTLPTGHRYGLAVGIAGYFLTNAVITRRLGGDARDILRWGVPSVLVPLLVVLQVAAVAPARTAVAAGALVTLAIIGLGKLSDRRQVGARSAPPPPFGDRATGSAVVADVSGLDTGR
jgi:hypothetical protein